MAARGASRVGARRGGWLAALALGLACSAGPRLAERAVSPDALPLPELAGGATRPVHVMLLSIAGFTPDLYGADGGGPMPTVASLAAAGVAAEAVEPVAPAATYPAHASLLSGQRPAAHGIASDHRLGERGVRATRYWHASHLRAPTLWQLAAQAGLRVAALGWPSTVGASIPQLLPDIVPTRRGETWLGVLADSATPELLAMARELGGESEETDRSGAARDAVIVGVACALLDSPAPPALLLVRLSQTEAALADAGPGSPQARAAFARADAELARLLRCLGRAAPLGASAVAVVGDHGTLPVHTSVSPNAALASDGLLAPGDGDGLERWSAVVRSNGGSAFVYAETDRAALRARRALTALAERTRAFRVVSAEEMLGVGADPDAWFGLEAEPGFVFDDSPQPPLLRAAAQRGAGGYLPQRAGMRVGFVAWGRGLRSGVRVPTMRQTDVAPTLARLLGVDLGEIDGRALIGALSEPAEGG